jgi:hypothetical protein
MADVVDTISIEWHRPRGGHREEGVEFKPLFVGVEGEPNNYWLTLVRVAERYRTPPHRHLFDQVRFMLEGGFNFGPQDQPEGTVGYFTEGTEYEQSGSGYSFHLLLQCEGGSRTRYFSGKSMRGATEALKQTGAFAGGRYRYADGREVDGYEAIYQHLTGTLPRYTSPRYERPIIMNPTSFLWADDPHSPGARWKVLGVFTERQLGLRLLQIDAGKTVALTAPSSGMLAYVVGGSGTCIESGGVWRSQSGIRLPAGERATLRATEATEMLTIDMPR